jgi:hypothetical protein
MLFATAFFLNKKTFVANAASDRDSLSLSKKVDFSMQSYYGNTNHIMQFNVFVIADGKEQFRPERRLLNVWEQVCYSNMQ